MNCPRMHMLLCCISIEDVTPKNAIAQKVVTTSDRGAIGCIIVVNTVAALAHMQNAVLMIQLNHLAVAIAQKNKVKVFNLVCLRTSMAMQTK